MSKWGDILLKGKTKIELIDTRNGHIDTYENTNMFTNGIQELLSYTSTLDNDKFESNIDSNGQEVSNYNGVLGNNEEYPTINYFTGGLLLFSDYVNEDANITSIPTNNQVIGRACLENNESTQIGSRNGSLVSKEFVNGKTYKYVWEFGEAQANGIISCVSLTTPLGATSVPLDDEETIIHPNTYPYTQNQFKCICDGKGNSSNSIMQGFKDESYFSQKLIAFIDGTNNCYYCFSSNDWDEETTSAQVKDIFQYWINNKKILLTKYRLPYNDFSIFDNRKNHWGEGIDDVDRVLDKIEIEIPNDINLSLINLQQTFANQTSARISVCNDDNYLYILLTNSARTQGEVTLQDVRDTINTETSFNNMISFNSDRTNTGLLYLMKIDITDFTMEAINLLSLDANICSWLGSAKDFYNYNYLSTGLLQRHYNINLINDIYVFNDYLYFFKKENVNFSNHTFDLVLCRAYINNLSTIENIKYNGEDIVIKCAVYEGDDKEPYNIINENRRFCGKYLNTYFSLGVPFVSMISNGQNLFVTFIENKKTFMIGDTTAYLLNENDNDLFNIKIKENLDTPVYPQSSSDYTDMYNSQYWKTGNNPLYFVYTPSAEKLFYIVGGNGKILKSSDTETKLVTEEDKFLIPYSVFNFKKEKNLWDAGCYSILRDSTPLITINNLENQVEKKSYQKMKVTYTITEV